MPLPHFYNKDAAKLQILVKLKTPVAPFNVKEASKECTISTTDSVLNILAPRSCSVKILSVTLPGSPHPHAVLVPVMSVWRLLVVSQQRFCEDKAELWVTLV